MGGMLRLGLIPVLVALSALPGRAAAYPPAQNGPLCFNETQQCIGGEFRDYWQQNGGLPVFGLPIFYPQGQVDAAHHQYTAQWFERNRLEFHAENTPPYNILLGRLGDEMLRRLGRDPLTLPPADPAVPHYYPPTRHAIAEVFWDYWRGHGLELGDPGLSERESLALFGYPISEPQVETNRSGATVLTQWFERARFEHYPNNPAPFQVQLGLLGNEIEPFAPQRALDRVNMYRARSGLVALAFHPAMMTAAQNHANYQQLNHFDNSAWEFGGHGEVEGKPGYTGRWPSDRIKVTGYPWLGGAEAAHGIGEPVAAVDGWMVSIPHRAIVMTPQARHTGYGRGSHSALSPQGVRTQVSVDVMVFGDGPPDSGPPPAPTVVTYPADGQTDVPIGWGGMEGYPFTIHGAYGKLRVDTAELREANGQVVVLKAPAPDGPAYNVYDLTAATLLRPNTQYMVHARGAVNEMPFDRTWSFTTGTWNGMLP